MISKKIRDYLFNAEENLKQIVERENYFERTIDQRLLDELMDREDQIEVYNNRHKEMWGLIKKAQNILHGRAKVHLCDIEVLLVSVQDLWSLMEEEHVYRELYLMNPQASGKSRDQLNDLTCKVLSTIRLLKLILVIEDKTI